jgi:hypothetical protein
VQLDFAYSQAAFWNRALPLAKEGRSSPSDSMIEHRDDIIFKVRSVSSGDAAVLPSGGHIHPASGPQPFHPSPLATLHDPRLRVGVGGGCARVRVSACVRACVRHEETLCNSLNVVTGVFLSRVHGVCMCNGRSLPSSGVVHWTAMSVL